MARQPDCECVNRYETVINSLALFTEVKEFFERDTFEDAPITVPLQILDDYGKTVTQWYPDKWYRCRVCGQLWAFDYPDFPARGTVFKLNAEGIPQRDSFFWDIRQWLSWP